MAQLVSLWHDGLPASMCILATYWIGAVHMELYISCAKWNVSFYNHSWRNGSGRLGNCPTNIFGVSYCYSFYYYHTPKYVGG